MASLETTDSGHYHVIFRFQGKRIKRALKTLDKAEANSRLTRLEETIRLVQSGRIEVPASIDVAMFLLSDGKVAHDKSTPPLQLTLKDLFRQFFDSIPEGNLEDNTLSGMHRHEKRLLEIIGADFSIQDLTVTDLQGYVKARCKHKTHYGTLVQPNTVHKELVTLGTVWRWAETANLVAGSFPRRGVRLPKSDELPPFQTWSEIERQISEGGISDAEEAVLWDALYLRRPEIDELLAAFKERSNHPFIYPMVVMAAHTGCRRSELVRSRRSDFDFDSSIVTIREKKRVHGRNTTRRVPITATLTAAMTEWFDQHHPGGPHTFCLPYPMRRSKYPLKAKSPLSGDQAHGHFERTLNGTKWEKLKGWHCLRHSFISNLASQGIDQRIIDDFVGHTTEQMRRRYRHLFPDVKQAAIDKVFG